MTIKKLYDALEITLDEIFITPIGTPLEVYIPKLGLAFLFASKETEKRIIAVKRYLCNVRRFDCTVIEEIKNVEVIERKIKIAMIAYT